MIRRFFLMAGWLVFLAPGVSCDGGSAKDPGDLIPPTLQDPGKTDGPGDAVDIRGRISFGGEAQGEFVVDGQLEGWFFTAAEGSVIAVENTHLGTTRALDSTLFIYGPKDADGFYGAEALVFDDDSGYGAHARIREFLIRADGEYLIVIGTYLNIDRGNYRLTLDCASGDCIVPCDERCLSEDPCSGQACSEIDGCIDTVVDPACTVEKMIVVDGGDLLTDEDGASDSFTVSLTVAPTDHVTVWVTSSSADEGVVYPLKLLFCMEGYEETANGCTPLEEGTVRDEPHWMTQISVTVTGVGDFTPDGDSEFAVSFEVVSEDNDYAQLAPEPLAGLNLDVNAGLVYGSLEGLSDEQLLAAILPLVDGHRAYGYLGQNSARTVMFSVVDLHEGWVESIYDGSRTQLPRDSSQAYAQGFNTEHTWPQAQFDKAEPMKSDLHHIFPTDAVSNSKRANYDYGMTSSPDATGSLLGYSELAPTIRVYQVRPDMRGDIARAHFYMAARYRAHVFDGVHFDDDSSSRNGVINDTEESILRAWHEADPVDAQERARNNRVAAYQGNRNPFIDLPDLVSRIRDF